MASPRSGEAAPRSATQAEVAGSAPSRFGFLDWVHRDHLLLAALVAFSWGSMVFFGTLDTAAVLDIIAALVLTGVALRVPAGRGGAGPFWWAASAAISATATLRYVGLFSGSQVTWLAVAIIATSALVAVARRRGVVVVAASAGGAAVVALAISGWRWGRASIDVFNLLQTSAAALMHGQNPYTPTGSVLAQSAPGVFIHQLHHFDYLPGAILLAAPGRVVGDVRLMSAVALAALVAFTLHAASSAGGAPRVYRVLALCIAAPTTVAMVYNSWLDVYSVAGFVGWIALRRVHRRWAVVCLVVALAVKPTLLLALLPLWLWSKRARLEGAIAVGATALLILPFAILTGFGAFYDDVVGIYGQLGFRYDGLTLSAWWFQRTGSLVPVGVSLVAGVAAAFFAFRRRPADLSAALISGAFLSTAAFLLAKQAFLNYYFIPTWLVILALAVRGLRVDAEAEIALPAPVLAVVRKTIARPLIGAEG